MRLTKLVLLLAALTLTRCETPQVPTAIVGMPRGNGYARGIDLPTDASDVLSELQRRPSLDFVARYYRDPASRWPPLTASEARRLSALGVKIVTVWEWHSHDPAYFSYATGYNDALSAYRQAKGVDQPPGSAIYFAVDFNARGSQLYPVDQYFRGINAGLAAAGGGRPEYKVGVYGSGAVCAAMRGARLAQYAWLSGSTAWDGTAGYNDWNIRQAAQGARFAHLSFVHDANEARSDYGGFQLGNYASTASPAEMAVTVAAAAPVAAATLVNGAVASLIPSPAPSIPAPIAPPTAPTPMAATAQAAPPAPVPTAPATARVAPATSTDSAAEVAALAAAEPIAAAPASSAAAPARRAALEPETLHSGQRSAKQAATTEEPPRDRTVAHTAKGSPASKAKVYAAASSRAVAAPPRQPGISHGATHKASIPRRSEDHHGPHPQAKKAGSKPSPQVGHHPKIAQKAPLGGK